MKDDMISRRAAIDAIEKNAYRHTYLDQIIDIVSELPSAQPKPCVDTIDVLNESIKHFDDMAEECRRNANIERNDYMDMRDDAAEYRQLSIWLNELKWLRERFQSQPEIVRCKDCKYYSPMNRETKTGICKLVMHQNFGDDWFCAGAERRTDAD